MYWILMMPFYYHFGSYQWFSDLISLFHEIGNILSVYYLALIFIGLLLYYRNVLFNIFDKNLFKNFFSRASLIAFLTHISFFFISIFDTIIYFLNRFFKSNK
uniref:Uncharacterized protein n=1 Tax=Pseudourostyla cristata TaxID=293816 RepID=A0A4P9JLE7_9SPIT|nr:hypothetical protein [Pseudourostyla cristata]